MFTETLNTTSRNDENMELTNSIEELDDDDGDDDDDDDDDDDVLEFPPLPSDIDLPSYVDLTLGPYDNRHRTIDLFYCTSPPFPSPPPPLLSPQPVPPPPLPPSSSSSSMTMTRIYANAHTFSSIRNTDSINQPMISFATQQKKKNRAPIACLLQSVYVNLPQPRTPPPPPPPPSLPPPLSSSNPTNTINEVTYATLLNTTSMVTSINSDLIVNHVEYQQIQHKSNEINRNRIYENVKSRPPPPPPPSTPTFTVQANIPQRPSSWSVIPVEDDKPLLPSKPIINNEISSSSAHIYINLECHKDKPPTLPSRRSKSVRTSMETSSSSSLSTLVPPVIPPRNEQRGDLRCSSSSITISSGQKEQDTHETSSNTSTIQVNSSL